MIFNLWCTCSVGRWKCSLRWILLLRISCPSARSSIMLILILFLESVILDLMLQLIVVNVIIWFCRLLPFHLGLVVCWFKVLLWQPIWLALDLIKGLKSKFSAKIINPQKELSKFKLTKLFHQEQIMSQLPTKIHTRRKTLNSCLTHGHSRLNKNPKNTY